MTPYQIGDNIIFSANNQDSFIVINKEICNSCNPINNESIGATYEAGGFIEYKKHILMQNTLNNKMSSRIIAYNSYFFYLCKNK